MGEDRLKGWDTGPAGGSSVIFSLSLRRGGQLADHRTAASQQRRQGCECEGPRGRAGCPRPCPLQEAFLLQPNTRSHLSSDVRRVIFSQRNCGGALDNWFPHVPLLAWVWCIGDTVNACWPYLFVFRQVTLNWSSGADVQELCLHSLPAAHPKLGHSIGDVHGRAVAINKPQGLT